MANYTPTISQQAAIDFGKGNLLVSAAAGSGKTATLANRMLRLITDSNSNATIDRMLIVTYTNAAASDLKSKIRETLQNQIKKESQINPKDEQKIKRLKEQLAKLSIAQIGTIHSYCFKLIKDHFSDLDISPDIRIADEIEIEMLKKESIRNVINTYYSEIEKGNIPPILSDIFGTPKSEDHLDQVILKFINTLIEHGYDETKLDEYKHNYENAYNTDFLKSKLSDPIKEYILRKLNYYENLFNDYMLKLEPDHKYINSINECIEHINIFRNSIDSYSQFKSHINSFSLSNLPQIRGDKTAVEVAVGTLKNSFSSEIKDLAPKYFSLDEAELKDVLNTSVKMCETLKPIINNFFDQFSKAKRNRNILDFSDLESKAYSILYNSDQTLSETAISEADRFDYIFIDEYQDTNQKQDKIFSAIGSKCGRFLVGDIKQSVYRFRGAEPKIFASYRDNWNKANDPKGSSIFLQNNFRCDKNIVDFTNIISNNLFPYGSISYTTNDNLIHSKEKDHKNNYPVEICITKKSSSKDKNQDDTEIVSQYEYVAKRINNILNNSLSEYGKRLKGSDIAILLRSTKYANSFVNALKKYGIKSTLSTSDDFFEQPEILLALSLLNTIDNPTRDIYLCGAMRSPIYSFTTDELIKIRKATQNVSLWQAVKLYNDEQKLVEKCQQFVSNISALRDECSQLTAEKAVNRIYNKTNILNIDFQSSNAKANLSTLYDMARNFDSGIFAGLYGFIQYVYEKKEKGKSIDTTPEVDPNAVIITTIHKSKGLEYQVCFLAETEKEFNLDDTTKDLIFDSEYGIASKISDKTGLTHFDTPIREAAVLKVMNNLIEEEMRILYVALTRARCRLIITGANNNPEELINKYKLLSKNSSSKLIYSTKNYLNWILLSIYNNPTNLNDCHEDVKIINSLEDIPSEIYEEEYYKNDENNKNQKEKDNDENIEEKLKKEEEETIRLTTLIESRIHFKYPNEYKKLIPSKITVSKLSPDVLNDEDLVRNNIDNKEPTFDRTATIPAFLSDDPGYDAATAGTATHMFLEFCNFERLSKIGSQKELECLIEQSFIPKEIAKLIDCKSIDKFVTSKIFAKILKAKYIRREFGFNVNLDAYLFTMNEDLAQKLKNNNEKILVQGIIDCLFIDENDNIIIVDYKTDHFPYNMLKYEREKVKDTLIERHKRQLTYYAKIASAIFKTQNIETYIFSFTLGESIKIDTMND